MEQQLGRDVADMIIMLAIEGAPVAFVGALRRVNRAFRGAIGRRIGAIVGSYWDEMGADMALCALVTFDIRPPIGPWKWDNEAIVWALFDPIDRPQWRPKMVLYLLDNWGFNGLREAMAGITAGITAGVISDAYDWNSIASRVRWVVEALSVFHDMGRRDLIDALLETIIVKHRNNIVNLFVIYLNLSRDLEIYEMARLYGARATTPSYIGEERHPIVGLIGIMDIDAVTFIALRFFDKYDPKGLCESIKKDDYIDSLVMDEFAINYLVVAPRALLLYHKEHKQAYYWAALC